MLLAFVSASSWFRLFIIYVFSFFFCFCFFLFVVILFFFFFNDTATTEIYTYVHTLSLHDALPISIDGEVLREDGSAVHGLYAAGACASNIAQDGKGYASGTQLGEGSFFGRRAGEHAARRAGEHAARRRSEEHTSELQSLMRISYAVFCLKKKNEDKARDVEI